MSAIKEFTDEIADQFLVCKICLETYNKPKTLGCLHTFCTSCLEKYLHAELERTQYRYVIYARCITCPVCRKRTEVPSGGVRDLPDNFLVSNLTEVVNRSKPSRRSPMCDFCSCSQRSSRVALSKCVECNKNMCRSCADLHRRTKVTRGHSIFDVKGEKNVVCKVHQDEPLRFFCQPCETCICVACTFHEHQGHEVASFGEGISKYAADMEAMTNLCLSKMETIQSQLNVITRCEETMSRVEEQIKSLASNLIVSIRLKQRHLLDEIRQYYGSEALELLDNKEELEQIMENLSSTCDLAQLVLKDRNVELLLLHNEVKEKMNSLIDFELPDLPESLFKNLKFVQGAMFFGYLDTGQEVKHIEYDVKPSLQLPPEVLAKLAVTSCVVETQTADERRREMFTTMDSDVVFDLPSAGVQTDEPICTTRRGSTQTENSKFRSMGTQMDSPILRNRAQNTVRRDSLFTNCSSQTNVEMIEALSACHPVIASKKASTFDACTDTGIVTHSVACDTGIRTANSGTTTEDLETELINKYLEMLENDEHTVSPPYNIPFPVDTFDQINFPSPSDTLPLINHLVNFASNNSQKMDIGANGPCIKDITNGREIEFTDVMVKDSGTNTDDLLPSFRDNPLYTYSDSYESSPEDTEESSFESTGRSSSDEDKFTDQGTLIDKDDLIQLLAGEELVQWDERSALHDMIILDRFNTKRNLAFMDSAMNTEAVPMASRSIMTDSAGSRTVATITVANITVDAGTSARLRRPRRENAGTSTERVLYSDMACDARRIDTTDFGTYAGPDTIDMFTSWQEPMKHSVSRDSDFISAPGTPSEDNSVEITPTLRRRSSLETEHLTEKLEGLFSMSKLQELTKKLERRPSQPLGIVTAVTRKLERQLSGDYGETAREALADYSRRKPLARRSSTPDMVARSERGPQEPSRPIAPPKIAQARYGNYRPKIVLKPQAPPKPVHEYHVEAQAQPQRMTIGARKQLARVRRPDITALLCLNTGPVIGLHNTYGDWGPFLHEHEFEPPRPRTTSLPTHPVSLPSTSAPNTALISSDSFPSVDTSSDFSSTSSNDSGTPILTPFTDESQSPVEGRSGTATPTGEWNIHVMDDNPDIVEVCPKETLSCHDDDSVSSVDSEVINNKSQKASNSIADVIGDSETCTADNSIGEGMNLKLSQDSSTIHLCASPAIANDGSVRVSLLDTVAEEPLVTHFDDVATSLMTSELSVSNVVSTSSNTALSVTSLPYDAGEVSDVLPGRKICDDFTNDDELLTNKALFTPPPSDRTCSVLVSPTIQLPSTSDNGSDSEPRLLCNPPLIIEYDDTANAPHCLPSQSFGSFARVARSLDVFDNTATPFGAIRNDSANPTEDFETRLFELDEHFMSLPTVDETSMFHSLQRHRPISPRPIMGKQLIKKKSDTLIRKRVREEPPRVVMGVSGIGVSMPRSKSLSTINTGRDSMVLSSTATDTNKTDSKRSLAKTIQSFFKPSKSSQKRKRNSSIM